MASEVKPTTTDDAAVAANAEAMLNLSMLDPPHWGWCALGGVADLLPPHERARRKDARQAFLRRKRMATMRKVVMNGDKVDVSRPSTKTPQHLEAQSAIHRSVEGIQGREPSVPGAHHVVKGLERAVLPSEPSGSLTSNDGTDRRKSEGPGSKLQKSTNGGVSIKEKGTLLGETTICSTGRGGERTVGDEVRTDQVTAARSFPLSVSTSLPPIDRSADRNRVLEVKALNEAGALDMFSYHRGREGLEPRDEETGVLLCDIEQTDSNYRWQKPNLTASITISFPLADGQNDADGEDKVADHANGESPEKESEAVSQEIGCASEPLSASPKDQRRILSAPQFRETIVWDLSDSRTPTAMTFASGVAQEFGLTYGQTLDLASSVQAQIDDFVRNRAIYNAPLSSKDPYGNEREFSPLVPPGFSMPPQLYGHGVTGKAGGETSRGVGGKQRKGSQYRMSVGTKGSSGRTPQVDFGVLPPHLLPRHDGPLPIKASRAGAAVPNPVSLRTEPEYREEVLRRAKSESAAEIEWLSRERREDGLVGVVDLEAFAVCHICHARKPHCAQFACGNSSHAYCDTHCRTRLGFSIRDSESTPVLLDHCPICCLACICPKCTRRLDSLSFEFKQRTLQQGTTPTDTQFPGILTACSAPRMQKMSKGGPRKSSTRRGSVEGRLPENFDRSRTPRKGGKLGARTEGKLPVAVPKVSASEFPREVCGGRDLDPGTFDDYSTMFSEKGNFVVRKDISETRRSPTSAGEDEVEEDGNVDYCHVCKKHGNLLCCDRCPRGFHCECIESNAVADKDWECDICAKEKAGLPDDLVDGKKSFDAICAAFVKSNYGDGALQSLQVLSMIHEMVTKLMKYEFGEIFRVPVDSSVVPGYTDIIKKPMDLGTIGSNLVNGIYAKRLEQDQSLDDAVTAVLQDVELVWHNCFTFNYQGSAIYRMAEVHRRRSLMIMKRSFGHLLGEGVKDKVDQYVSECERERGIVTPTDSSKSNNHFNRRPNGRNKISVPYAHGGTSRTIAVLDPASGMIVKLYRSMRGAGLAAKCLSDLGNMSEYTPISDHLVKGIIHRSSKDPRELLFGYRWLFYDNLRDGKVQFQQDVSGVSEKAVIGTPKFDSGYVEMTDGENKYVFISVEEAISFIGLPEYVSIEELRKELLGRPLGETFSFAGRSWRRWFPKPRKSKKESLSLSNGKCGVQNDVGIELCPAATISLDVDTETQCFQEDGLESTFPPSVTIVKEDLVSRRKLLGFETVSSAYRDWLSTRESTPGFPGNESTGMEYFQLYYLDGDRNIDGLVWKTLRKQTAQALHSGSNGVVETEQSGSEAAQQASSVAPSVVAQHNEASQSSDAFDQPSQNVNNHGRNQSHRDEVADGILHQDMWKSHQLQDVADSEIDGLECVPQSDGDAVKGVTIPEKSLSHPTAEMAGRGFTNDAAKEGGAFLCESQDKNVVELDQKGGNAILRANDGHSKLGNKGIKRSLSNDRMIERNSRVAKKLAITTA